MPISYFQEEIVNAWDQSVLASQFGDEIAVDGPRGINQSRHGFGSADLNAEPFLKTER